jgi:hypothetical protein
LELESGTPFGLWSECSAPDMAAEFNPQAAETEMSLLAVVFQDLPAGFLQFCAMLFQATKDFESVRDIVTAETGGVDTARGVLLFRTRLSFLLSHSNQRRTGEEQNEQSRTNSNDHCHEACIHQVVP